MDELHGIMTTYEMRIDADKLWRKEVAFKVSKKQEDIDSKDDSYLEESKKLKKSQRVSKKYKGKLSFKCFNCG